MDKNVYGDSLAAIKLAKMVGEHPNSKIMSRKVGRLLEAFFRRINAIELINDRGDIEHLYILLIEDIEKNKLDFLCGDVPAQDYQLHDVCTCERDVMELETKIRSHILNVIKGRYKAWKHGERDSISRREIVGHSRIYRSVGGLTTIHRDMEVGRERFKRRAL